MYRYCDTHYVLLRYWLYILVGSQIKEKLLQLTDKRKDMIDKWEDRWEWLRLSKAHPPYICFHIIDQ